MEVYERVLDAVAARGLGEEDENGVSHRRRVMSVSHWEPCVLGPRDGPREACYVSGRKGARVVGAW